MRRLIILGVVAVFGIFTLAPTAGHAGSGAGDAGLGLATFFVCHAINGAKLKQKVDIHVDDFNLDPDFNLEPQKNVEVGNAVLACAQVRLTIPEGSLPGDEIVPVSTDQQLKCYNVSVPHAPGTPGKPPQWTVNDTTGGFGTNEDLKKISALQILCAPATFTLVP